jgi:hypothetical protein
MIEVLKNLNTTHTIAAVGGSDVNKLKEQLKECKLNNPIFLIFK